MQRPETLSIVGAGLTSLRQVPEISANHRLRYICLHGNDISEIHGLQHLTELVELNLSSNSVCSLQGLSSLTSLTSLNLASNRLGTLDGISALVSLERLNVAHNFISSLDGLATLQGCTLSYLDCRNNQISSVHSLTSLAGLTSLQELLLSGGSPGNPCCQWPSLRAAVAAAFPNVAVLDGRPLEEERRSSEARQLAKLLPQQLAAVQLRAFTPAEPDLQPLQPSPLATQHWQPFLYSAPYPPPSPLRAQSTAHPGCTAAYDAERLSKDHAGPSPSPALPPPVQQPQHAAPEPSSSMPQPSTAHAASQTPAASRKIRHKGCSARSSVSSKSVQADAEPIPCSEAGTQADLTADEKAAMQQQLESMQRQLDAGEADASEQIQSAVQAKQKAMGALKDVTAAAESQASCSPCGYAYQRRMG
ncbi:leucine rich repeat [Sticta canariensis]|nr:leucine rich repeat [Sticta canariensis]